MSADSDKLDVFMQLPAGFETADNTVAQFVIRGSKTFYMYRCSYCDGWISGEPDEQEEDSLEFLSGRRGVSLHCRRCGREIGFRGIVS